MTFIRSNFFVVVDLISIFHIGCDIFKSPYSMYESRFTDLNITTVPTSSSHPDSLNLIQQHHQQQQTNDNHNATNSSVIQSSTDAIGQHNNNDTSHLNNNNLGQGIKTENQSPPNHATSDEHESSRYDKETKYPFDHIHFTKKKIEN